MKRYLIQSLKIAAATLLLLSASCMKLEHEDSTAVQLDRFLKNEDDMRLYVYSLYRPFCSSNGDADVWGFYATLDAGYYALTEYTTDIMITDKVDGNENGRALLAVRHAWTLNSNQVMNPLTSKYFPQLNHISRARMAYLRLKDLNLQHKEKYAAEAQAIVGWTGMILYDMFGPLPVPADEQLRKWDADPLAGDWLPKLSREAYLDYMISNMEEAIPHLPEAQSDWGRITKGAGRMLLLRFYLLKGDHASALPVAKALYEMGAAGGGGIYDLEPEYKDIFKIDASGVKEMILAIPCDGTKDYSPNQWYGQVMPTDYPKPSAATVPSPGHRMRWAFYDTYEAADKRLATIVSEYYPNGDATKPKKTRANGMASGALPFKYQPDPNMIGNFARNDIPVFRYAEAILIYAECEFEVNGMAAAIPIINKVRTRAGLGSIENVLVDMHDGNPKVFATGSAAAFREAIFMERAHELYCEGVRRMDLIRQSSEKWVQYGKLGLQKLDPYGFSIYNEDANRCVFPIDPDVIRLSGGVIEQNVAYK